MAQSVSGLTRTGYKALFGRANLPARKPCAPRHDERGAGSALLRAALTKENVRQALRRGGDNKGGAGVDRMG